MSDINAPLSGGYVDERRVPPPPEGKTYEREYDGSYVSVVGDNGRAKLLSGATSPPEPYQCPVSDYEDQKVSESNKSRASAIDNLRTLGANNPTRDPTYTQRYKEAIDQTGNLPSSEFVTGDDLYRMRMIESAYDDMNHAKAVESPERFERACKRKNAINGQTSVTGAKIAEGASIGLMAAGAALTRPQSKALSGAARVSPGQALKPSTKSPRGVFFTKVPKGEPVSVANGEYLETWRDFLVPGALALDGTRYMGLRLGLPRRYRSPLGPCQISMFDEIVSNPSRGKLTFHDAEGRVIGFDRPFNFLPSQNAGYPHLELKAPWLKQLQLKDRRLVKHFLQYPDKIYRLERIEDLNGLAIEFTRNSTGLLHRVDGPEGLSIVFDNDADERRVAATLIGTDGSALELTRYAYEPGGRMVSADCAFGMSVRYLWRGDADLLDHWEDAGGVSATDFDYDERGRVSSTRTTGLWNGDRFVYRQGETDYLPGGDAEATQRFAYDENDNVTTETHALGGVTRHRYDAAGFRVSTTDPNGGETKTKYDAFGNVREHVDPEGRSTIYGWGPEGQLDLVIDGANGKRRYEHDDRANVVAEIDPEGHRTELVRDDKGRVVEKRFASGGVERMAYDGYGRLVSLTDAAGNVTVFAYDAFNRLLAATDALGGVTRNAYTAGPGGFDTRSAIVRPDGIQVARSFDGQGQLASVSDGEGRCWTYEHGAFGMPMAITDPKGGRLALATDIEGRVTAVTNALGRTYGFDRDKAGRVVAETDFDGRVTSYRRDPAGQVIEALKPDGARLAYAYDRSGLVTRIEAFRPDGRSEDVTRFWYDGRGLIEKAENAAALVVFERDKAGRIIAETLNGQRVASRLDGNGDRVALEIAGVPRGLCEYIRDPLGTIERILVGDRAIRFKRDALGREVRRESGGFALEQAYDRTGQLVGQRAGANGATGPLAQAAGRVYAYDGSFAPTRVSDLIWGDKGFFYDAGGQLTDASRPGGHEVFAYDEARNLVGASAYAPGAAPRRNTSGGLSAHAEGFGDWRSTPGGVVQIARGPSGERIALTHDVCGRVVERIVERDGFRRRRWIYEWSAEGRLVACVGPDGARTLFRYDPFGRRVAKVRCLVVSDGRRVPPDTEVGTAYLWDGDHMIAEAPLKLSGAIDWGSSVRWNFEEGGHRLLAREGPEGEFWPVVCDALGSPQEMFDEAGALVWAADRHVWGAVRAVRTAPRTSGALALAEDDPPPFSAPVNAGRGPAERDPLAARFLCPWRFPGQYEDAETGLFYNRHRHYDPLTAQYASPDPIGLAGGDRPQGYVTNPTAWTDPLGLAAYPRGFESRGQFDQAMSELKAAAAKDGLPDVTPGARGSSVTGKSYHGWDYDKGPKGKSDIDVFVEGIVIKGKTNKDGFIHPKKIHRQYPNMKEWSERWSKTLGRDVSVGGWNPSAPAEGAIKWP